MPYHAVMFDLDGTLLDTLVDITHATNHAMRELGHTTYTPEQVRRFVGHGLERLMLDALGPGRTEDVPRGMALFRAYYARHGLDHTAPFQGIPDLLDQLRQRGLTLSVLSNKPHAATRDLVAQVFAQWGFRGVRGARPEMPLKPDPAAALAIARELEIAPEQWIYVGDSDVDILTARGAGMLPVGVAWGFRDEAELREHGAAVILREPLELLDLLKGRAA